MLFNFRAVNLLVHLFDMLCILYNTSIMFKWLIVYDINIIYATVPCLSIVLIQQKHFTITGMLISLHLSIVDFFGKLQATPKILRWRIFLKVVWPSWTRTSCICFPGSPAGVVVLCSKEPLEPLPSVFYVKRICVLCRVKEGVKRNNDER